jgi:hypothetical protein
MLRLAEVWIASSLRSSQLTVERAELNPSVIPRAKQHAANQYAAAFRFNRWDLWNTGSSAFADDDSSNYSRGMTCPKF